MLGGGGAPEAHVDEVDGGIGQREEHHLERERERGEAFSLDLLFCSGNSSAHSESQL